MCGQVRGYQYGTPLAFHCYIQRGWFCFKSQIQTGGITLTYSNNPRKHIWTYAGGRYEQGTSLTDCPCNNGSPYVGFAIPFVGNDYYCESGTNNPDNSVVYNDPLWDGQDCPGLEATCCTSAKMPWFVKTLNETVNDDIELSTCGDSNGQSVGLGNPLDLVELYIK